jgi:tetratricopeptide (TPR) repeat protein
LTYQISFSNFKERLQRVVANSIVVWLTLLFMFATASPARTLCSFVEPKARKYQTSAESGDQTVPNDLVILDPGKPISRELSGGEVHSYKIILTAGQYLRVAVDQRGINLIVTLYDANGKRIAELDSSVGLYGVENLSLISEAAGSYRLEIRSKQKAAPTGRYEVRVVERRTVMPQDAIHIAAERAFAEATLIADQGTGESRLKAIDKYKEAVALWQSIKRTGAESQVALTLNAIGENYRELGDTNKALDYYTQALPIFRTAGDHAGEAATLNNLGDAYLGLGQPQEALDYSNQALTAMRTVGDRRGEAIALNTIGLVHSILGDKLKALDYQNQSLAILRDFGERELEAIALGNIGEIYIDLGEYQKALEYCNKALLSDRALGNVSNEAVALSNIGFIYGSLGDNQQELVYYTQALELQRRIGNRTGQAITLNNIAHVHSKLGDKQKALEFYERSLTLRRASNDRRGEAVSLSNIGSIHQDLGDYQKALDYYNQSLTIIKATGDLSSQAVTLNNIGSVYRKRGDSQNAINYIKQAYTILHDTGHKNEEAQAVYNMARVERDRGNLVEARRYIEKSLATVEALRTSVASQKLRASFFASVRRYQEFNINLLMRMHRQRPSEGFDVAALEASENARARSLLELLKEARAEIRQGVDPSLLEHERQLRETIADKAERQTRLTRSNQTEEQRTAAEKEIAALTTEYEQVQAEIRHTSPRYAALTEPVPLGLKAIQQQVLDEDTLLLEYALGEETSFLWAATPTWIKSFELPGRSQIEQAARRIYETLTARNQSLTNESPQQRQQRLDQADAEFAKAATALSETLLAPVASELKSRRLLIVTEGMLQYLPFGALPSPKSPGSAVRISESDRGIQTLDSRITPEFPLPLIAEHEIVSLPSASVLAVLRQESAGRKTPIKTVAVMADPVFSVDDSRIARQGPKKSAASEQGSALAEVKRAAAESGVVSLERLRFSRMEAEAISSLASDNLKLKALDFAANRAAAMNSDLGQYRIVHFATHGLINNEHAELSGVVLSLVDEQGRPQNGFLRLYDIYNLKLGADLVVLSACQTALGKEIKGEGIVGLTRGFMYAGAPRVVASLWQIDDRATAELMKRFYAGMLREKLRPAAALREAQVSMLKEKRWQAPYYWAAFTFQGEWK